MLRMQIKWLYTSVSCLRFFLGNFRNMNLPLAVSHMETMAFMVWLDDPWVCNVLFQIAFWAKHFKDPKAASLCTKYHHKWNRQYWRRKYIRELYIVRTHPKVQQYNPILRSGHFGPQKFLRINSTFITRCCTEKTKKGWVKMTPFSSCTMSDWYLAWFMRKEQNATSSNDTICSMMKKHPIQTNLHQYTLLLFRHEKNNTVWCFLLFSSSNMPCLCTWCLRCCWWH